jgi:tRNA pseudouridine13 synthase
MVGIDSTREQVPYGMRSLWLHAYQSLLWNKLATKRVEMGRGTQNPFAALPGDLVRVRVETTDQSSLLTAAVDKNEQIVTLGASGDGADGTVRKWPLSAGYTLDDVLLPVLGRGSVLPTNEIGEPLADRCRGSVIECVPSCCSV